MSDKVQKRAVCKRQPVFILHYYASAVVEAAAVVVAFAVS